MTAILDRNLFTQCLLSACSAGLARALIDGELKLLGWALLILALWKIDFLKTMRFYARAIPFGVGQTSWGSDDWRKHCLFCSALIGFNLAFLIGRNSWT